VPAVYQRNSKAAFQKNRHILANCQENFFPPGLPKDTLAAVYAASARRAVRTADIVYVSCNAAKRLVDEPSAAVTMSE